MDKFVREQLNSFLQQHVPATPISDLDDVLLDYVVEVLSSLQDHDENSFDVDQLCEMIAAYIPEFTQVDSAIVSEWVFQVAQDISTHQLKSSPPQQDSYLLTKLVSMQDYTDATDSLLGETTNRLEEKLIESASVTVDTDQNSDTAGETCQCNDQTQIDSLLEGSIDPDKLSLLLEIFPDLPKSDIVKTLQSRKGDIDECIQALLESSELSQSGQPVQSEKKEHKVHLKKALPCVKDDNHLKDSILSKYAFVDTKEDKRSHRPCLPVQEPKKLVRYRDNQVVNTKGERFTILTKRDQEGDELKKTYVNIKPLRKYRFH